MRLRVAPRMMQFYKLNDPSLAAASSPRRRGHIRRPPPSRGQAALDMAIQRERDVSFIF
jgi:hypothetical protein